MSGGDTLRGRVEMAAVPDGRKIAEAWMLWRDSEDGKSCRAAGAEGHYLENRLWRAFVAGAYIGSADTREPEVVTAWVSPRWRELLRDSGNVTLHSTRFHDGFVAVRVAQTDTEGA